MILPVCAKPSTPILETQFWSSCPIVDELRTSFDEPCGEAVTNYQEEESKSKNRVAKLDFLSKTTVASELPFLSLIVSIVPTLQLLFAFFMLLSFFVVRVPAIIFAREKEIVYKLELSGTLA